ncbi:hypothetical protein [Clostridium sp. D53t1_180928_C8]|uniref:hypothetical protein n=1 Tax=Clostridium sp. D53t1_180928_C8 TaxID=2787101 RepID=UPI0018AA63D6|nr:hypothetical protein [Clostridium sp. D53t1_180928_C8]
MNTNGQVINKVFNDKNINKDEKYMFLMFISMIEEAKDEVTISIANLMNEFQTKCKKKVLGVLKSLENKGYIEIIKSIGKTNKYKVIKGYIYTIINKLDHRNKENQYNDENYYTGDFYNKNTSSNREPGSNITSSNLDTSREITRGNSNTSSNIASGNIEPGINDYKKYAEYEENSGVEDDLTFLEDKRYRDNYDLNNNYYYKYNNKNNIYINKNNNKLYINIFNAWNEIDINNEQILYPSVKSAIEYAINTYGEDEVIAAIRNYGEVYYSDYYYDFGWNLISFLRKPNAIKRFLNHGDMWSNYSRKLEKEKREEEFKINIEDYID